MSGPKIKDVLKEWVLPAKGEFRFEVSFTESIALSVHYAQDGLSPNTCSLAQGWRG